MRFAYLSESFVAIAFLAGSMALAGCASDGDTGRLEPAHMGSDAIGPANPASSADTGASYLGSNHTANSAPGDSSSVAPVYGK